MTIEFRIEGVMSLSEHLGNPQQSIPCYIHVAGILGKTSTSNYLTRLIRVGSDLRIGSFTHPPVKDWRNCIKINEQPLEETAYSELHRHVTKVDEIFGLGCTKYELLFMVALLAFKDSRCDVIIVEAALGGTFDATNVLGRGISKSSRQLAAVITTIAEDHTKYLGHGLGSITTNVVGIVRTDAPVFIAADQPEAVMDALKQLNITPTQLVEPFGHMKASDFFLGLPLHQQLLNVDLAIRTYQTISTQVETLFGVKCKQPTRGSLADLAFPHTFAEFYYQERRVIVDAAQNGGATLCQWLRESAFPPNETIHLVMGVSDKGDLILLNFLRALGIRSQYQYSFVSFTSPDEYLWIHPAGRHHLISILNDVYSEDGKAPPRVTNHKELTDVLADMHNGELVVIFGSPYIVRDFYRIIC